MKRSLSIFGVAFALGGAGALGCYTGASIDPGSSPATAQASTEPSSASVSGVPCDVADVLARECNSCHGSSPSGGATNSLTTYEQLAGPSKSDPSKTEIQLSIERIKATTKPMPPTGTVAPADLAVLEKWVAAGMPKGDCAAAAGPSYDTPLVCTSNARWTRGDHESPLMHPGVACIDCHTTKREGPSYSVAGTVYPTAHEPDDCNGKSSSTVKVVITGADGKATTLSVNQAGNFFARTRIAMPYTAKVVDGAKVREMKTPTSDGDCNGCHTEKGAEKAPGRIMAP
ncbi:MAG: hypothetical protein JST00_42290 [Deltaproteobacteria bacterium]|nr:hypothetical protein [Deltaproteobacteria bacterium]